MAEYYIELRHRDLPDGRTIYGVTVGQAMRKQMVVPGDGLGLLHRPADTHDAAIEKVRDVLEQYRNPKWRQDDRPAPTVENAVLRDETGEFGMDDFFDATLQTFIQEGEA